MLTLQREILVFRGAVALGLLEYDEMAGIAWEWQSVDGAIMKVPLVQQAVGPNRNGSGKKREQVPFAGRRSWCRDRSQCQ